MQQSRRDFCDFFHRGEERGFIRFRGLGEAADLAHELQRCRANFFWGYGRIEIEQRFDIAAHSWLHLSFDVDHPRDVVAID